MNDHLQTESFIISNPKVTWEWDMFGGGLMVVHISENCPQPTWYQRFMTRLLFRSIWKRL